MKNLMVAGIVAVMVVSIFAGITTATNRDDTQWGFDGNLNLHDEFNSYLELGYDSMIYELNREFASTGSGYQITDHGSSLYGEILTAGAMSRDGNNVNFKMGNYIGSKVELTASGTFPYANTIEEMANGTLYPRDMDVSLTMYFNNKMTVSGTAVTDGNGNVTSTNSALNYDMYLHIKGNNLPLPYLLYSMLKSRATQLVDTYVDFYLANVTNNSICFRTSIITYTSSMSSESEYNPSQGLKISGLSINYPYARLQVMDENENGYLDDGELLCIVGNVSEIKSALDNGTMIYVTYTDPTLDIYENTYLSYYGWDDDFDLDSMYIEYQYVDPEISSILNQTKDLPPYDNFDFTVTVNYTQHALTVYSPYLPLLPRKDRVVNITRTGAYSGMINIQGLQNKYMRIVEKVLNLTFPVNIKNINTHNSEFNNGKINVHTTIYIPSMDILGMKNYGGEKVYIVSIPSSSGNFGFYRATSSGMYYYYSPSKKFIVGEGISEGFKEYSTEPTSYQNANSEINQIKNKDITYEVNENNNCNIFTCTLFTIGPLSFNLLILSIIAAIAVVIVAIVAVYRRKSKIRGQNSSPPGYPQNYNSYGGQNYYNNQGYEQNYDQHQTQRSNTMNGKENQ